MTDTKTIFVYNSVDPLNKTLKNGILKNVLVGFVKPTNICLFKFNNRNTRRRSEMCSKLKIKTPERRN